MKKLLLICLLFIGVASAAIAQSAVYGTFDTKQRAKKLQQSLKLTDNQTAKIAAVYSEAAATFEKIKVKEKGDNAKIAVAFRPVRDEAIAKIKAVLQPKQVIEYDKLIKANASSSYEGWAPNQGTD